MGRLYYDEDAKSKEFNLEEETPNQSNTKSYLEKVSMLIPAEIIAGYLAMFGFAENVNNPDTKTYVYWGIFFLCLVLTPIYFAFQAEKGNRKFIHLMITSTAFVIWAYVTTGNILIPNLYEAAIASILLIAFSLIAGLIPLKK